MHIERLRQQTKGIWLQKWHSEAVINELIIDSRQLLHPQNSMFIALRGDYRSGIDFINDVYQKGVRNFLIDENVNLSIYPNANFIIVNDCRMALQDLAKAIRMQYQYPVIGITGSNGKTIVKEWLSHILSKTDSFKQKGGVIKSPKSYNSQIGVPLSIWQMSDDNTIAIIEAGISQPHEMRRLAEIIRPDIGIFTNLGDAHSEHFESNKEKLKEKFELFHNSQSLIINRDDQLINDEVNQLLINNTNLKIIDWSYQNKDASLFVHQVTKNSNFSNIAFDFHNQTYTLLLPFTHNAFLENAIIVLTTLLHLGIKFETIKDDFMQLSAVAMRLEMRDALNGSQLISDTYNSDKSSLKVALSFLKQQNHSNKTLIISDMLESGKDNEKEMAYLAKLIQSSDLKKLIGIGPKMYQFQSVFEKPDQYQSIFYNDTNAFLADFKLKDYNKEMILLKGSRAFNFERIQQRLEQQIHHTILEVDLEALAHNFNIYRQLVGHDTKMMAMVKAYSYGSGSLEIANKLKALDVDYLAVAYTDEGISLRNDGINLPIMVMSPEIHSFESMLRWQLEPEIFNLHSLKILIAIAKSQQEIHYPIHIKLNTGMNRLGFDEKDIPELLNILLNTETVRVASIFSHLAASDDLSFKSFTNHQFQLFNKMVNQIISKLKYRPLLHIVNTSGMVNFNHYKLDMVRLGIGLYGYDSSQSIQKKLKHVSTMKTYIVQLREVPKTETVGYGRNGHLKRDAIIATVALGYADGYFRKFGNGNAYMLVHNKKAPLVGNICMDMCMLDVTDIENVSEGDEVIAFGKEPSILQLANWSETIPYEILTNISQRVKRLYVNE